MVIVKDKGSYLLTCRVLLGDFFGVSLEEAFVELRETDTRTAKRLSDASKKTKQGGDDSEMVDVFLAELPDLVVAHSFYKPNPDQAKEPELMSGKEVISLIADRLAPFERVVTEYSEKVLFTQGKKSEPSSST